MPEAYPYAYLVTAPRFLGYCFNPVSFWYLYTEKKELGAMVLEVNNTFDERRMYFMKRMQESHSALADRVYTKSAVFRSKWSKDFHVSPFNSRKGSYSLKSFDPFWVPDRPRVDNAITLSSSSDHGKIVAKLFSSAAPIRALRLTARQKLAIAAQWWWVGLITYPRIVKEAGKLFFLRRLHVWFRPEVVKTGIGRSETSREA